MAISKKEREIVFNKCGGRCAYCGDELSKGWHVDHKEPINRRWKYAHGHIVINGKNKLMTREEIREYRTLNPDAEFKMYSSWKQLADGCDNPENECIENYMPSCASCNINKSSMGLESFRKSIAYYVQSLNNNNNTYRFAKRYGLIQETNISVVFYFETISI